MKKVLCVFLSLMLLLGCLAGCASSEKPQNDNAGNDAAQSVPAPEAAQAQEDAVQEASVQTAVQIPADLPHYKIGVSYTSFTTAIGALYKASLESLGEAYHVEFVFLESSGVSSEQAQMALDTALQSGLDGLISVSASASIMESAKTAGDIPVVAFQFVPRNDDVQAELVSYSNYLGSVASDDYACGMAAADALYEAGSKNIAVCAMTPGLSKSQDQRVAGFLDGVAQHDDMKVIADDYSRGDYATAISAFAAAYPEMDGIFATFANESVYQTIFSEGLVGTVKLATADISDSVPDFLDSGTLVYVNSGNLIMESFAVLYNYLYDGTKLIPDGSVVYFPFIDIHSSEEYETYMKYVEGELPVYTPEEFAELIHGFNPEMTAEKLLELADAYSLDSIVARHKGMVE